MKEKRRGTNTYPQYFVLAALLQLAPDEELIQDVIRLGVIRGRE